MEFSTGDSIAFVEDIQRSTSENGDSTNGLAFSPDEKYLYVNASVRNYISRYEVRPDGTLANDQMF